MLAVPAFSGDHAACPPVLSPWRLEPTDNKGESHDRDTIYPSPPLNKFVPWDVLTRNLSRRRVGPFNLDDHELIRRVAREDAEITGSPLSVRQIEFGLD